MKKLNKAKVGKIYIVKKVSGNPDTLQFLSNLGIVEGEEIMVVSKIASNIVINILDTRYGLDENMAKLI